MASFEDALKEVGEFGRYQKFIYFFCVSLVVWANVFTNLPIVFLAATPDHWCKTPSLDHLNVSRDIYLNLTVPTKFIHGKLEYSHCYQYDRDFSNWTQDDVTEDLTESGKSFGNVSTLKCRSGWDYDDSVYASTVVSEVRPRFF